MWEICWKSHKHNSPANNRLWIKLQQMSHSTAFPYVQVEFGIILYTKNSIKLLSYRAKKADYALVVKEGYSATEDYRKEMRRRKIVWLVIGMFFFILTVSVLIVVITLTHRMDEGRRFGRYNCTCWDQTDEIWNHTTWNGRFWDANLLLLKKTTKCNFTLLWV